MTNTLHSRKITHRQAAGPANRRLAARSRTTEPSSQEHAEEISRRGLETLQGG